MQGCYQYNRGGVEGSSNEETSGERHGVILVIQGRKLEKKAGIVFFFFWNFYGELVILNGWLLTFESFPWSLNEIATGV